MAGCVVYRRLETPRCTVEVRRRCGPRDLEGLRLAQGFGFFVDPSEGVERLVLAAERGDYVAVAVHGGEVVGFLVAARWTLEGPMGSVVYDDVYDINVEVSRRWRRMGIGRALLEAAVTDPFFEDKVLLVRGNPRYWDCRGVECRRYAHFIMEVPMLHYGFKRVPADLPGDLFTLARPGPRAGRSVEDIARAIEAVSGAADAFSPF